MPQKSSGAAVYMQRGAGRDFYHGDRYIGIDKTILGLPRLHLLDGDCRLDDELFLFAGITGRRFWPRSNLELRVAEPDGRLVQDDFSHEQCLVLSQNGQHILLSGCAHSGILNILDRYRELFGDDPDVVISGFHMKKADPYTDAEWQTIEETGRALQGYRRTRFFTGHCHGWTGGGGALHQPAGLRRSGCRKFWGNGCGRCTAARPWTCDAKTRQSLRLCRAFVVKTQKNQKEANFLLLFEQSMLQWNKNNICYKNVKRRALCRVPNKWTSRISCAPPLR